MKNLTPFVAYLLVYLASCISSFAESFEETKRKAEQGDAVAQFNLGYIYDNADGVQQDFKEAFKWYLKAAAEQRYAPAQFSVGLMYEYGTGVPKSFINAAWYNLSDAGGKQKRCRST